MQEQRHGLKDASQSQRGPTKLGQEKMGLCVFKSCLRPATGSVVINYYDYFSRTLGKDKEGERGRQRGWGGQHQQWGGRKAPLAEQW